MHKINNLDVLKLIESAHIGVVIHAWDTTIVYANPQALSLLRLTSDQIVGKVAYDTQWHFIDDNYVKVPVEEIPVNRVIAGERIQNQLLGLVDGMQKGVSWMMVNAYAEPDLDDGGLVVVTFIDVTDSRQGFSFEQIVENAQDIVVVTEAEQINAPLGPKIVYVNKAFETLTGYSKKEVQSETPRILQGSLTDKTATKRIHDALAENKVVTETLLNYSKNGHPYWLDINIFPLRDRNGEVTHFAAIERDVSEKRFQIEQLTKRNQDLKLLKDGLKGLVEERTKALEEANEKLALLAYVDPLTNIPNRRAFVDQTTRLIHFCQRHGHVLAIGLMDIDDFKIVNDTFGHDIGDKVLSDLGAYFKEFFRQNDAYCRWGGEEFAFAVVSEDVAGVETLSQRLLSGIRDLQFSTYTNQKIKVTVSIGGYICLPKAADSLDGYMKLADNALYNAKSLGKNAINFTVDID